jgi:MFS family permease
MSDSTRPAHRLTPAHVVVLAGVCAALHVGKLAPAIGALQAALGLTLLQAGFLLSLVQAAGMSAGLALGAFSDRLGGRRSVLLGLCLLSLASVVGGLVGGLVRAVPLLMGLRVLEGLGFLLVVLPAPGLVRTLVPVARLPAMLGLWGAYMPLGTACVLLAGPVAIAALGWQAWWWLLGAVTGLMALWFARAVPVAVGAPGQRRLTDGLRGTLASLGPWLVALMFACYSSQWLAVIGFLPTIYLQAGIAPALTGVLTALAAAANIGGNVLSGRLLQQGVAPRALLWQGFTTMAVTAVLAFADLDQPPALRYGAVLLFSAVGGLIPGTLFSMALRVAPGDGAVAATVGWVQQWSSAGQFLGPPLAAALASRVGGWQFTWVFCLAVSGLGVLLAGWLADRLAQPPKAAQKKR